MLRVLGKENTFFIIHFRRRICDLFVIFAEHIKIKKIVETFFYHKINKSDCIGITQSASADYPLSISVLLYIPVLLITNGQCRDY